MEAADIGVKPRKAASLTMRMTQTTRDRLEAAAKREGRSVSEMAERWLDLASEGAATFEERIGGSQIGVTIEAMLEFAKKVEAEVGNPRTFLPARDALISGWRYLADEALPYTPDTPEGQAFRLARTGLRVLARNALERILTDADGLSEPTVQALYARPKVGNALAPQTGLPLSSLIAEVAHGGPPYRLTVKELGRRASEAAAIVAETDLADLLRHISQQAEAFEAAYEPYMKPREAAAEKGRALAESMMGIESLSD